MGIVVIGVYVDCYLVTGSNATEVDNIFEELSSLQVKDLGHAHKFLRMQIRYSAEDGYDFDQEVKITDMLKEHGLKFAHGAKTSISDD